MQITYKIKRILRIVAGTWLTAAVIFFGANIITQSAWKHPSYSWETNNISDLGQVTCAFTTEHVRYVCSPLHAMFNSAVMIGGLLIIVGLVLSHSLWRRHTFAAWVARLLLIVGASGWIIAGKYPFDVNENLHVLGAALILLFGNVGLLLSFFGLAKMKQLTTVRYMALVAGSVALTAGFLQLSGHYLGLGMGGMERVAVFPLPLWMFLSGISVWRIRSIAQNNR